MEANLLAAVEPSALALGELQHGYGDQQPEADAREKQGQEAGADGANPKALELEALRLLKEAGYEVRNQTMLGFLIRPASVALIAAVAAAQLVWVALLVYGAYSAAVWLPL